MEAHPDESDEDSDKENIVLKLVAEQTNTLMGEVASLKKDTREVFNQIADIFTLCINKIKKDSDEKCITLGNTVTKILDKVTKLEKAVVNSTDQTLIHSTRVPKKKTFAEIVDKDVKQAPAAVETKNISSKSSSFIPPALPPAKNEPIPSKPVKNTSFLRQEKVLFVGELQNKICNCVQL